MKKTYLNSRLWIVLIFSLFVIASFYSCKKEGGNKEESLSGTFWESNSFEGEIIVYKYKDGVDTKLILQCDKIIIYFQEEMEDNIKHYWADITFKNSVIIEDGALFSFDEGIIHGNCSYTYDGKSLTIKTDKFDSSQHTFFSPERNWTGSKINKNTMKLENVMGTAIVEFRRS